MERPIQEDPAIRDPARWGFVAFVVLLLLFATALATWRLHSWTVFLQGLGMTAAVIAFSSLILLSVRRDRRSLPRPTWNLTDEGLQRVYPSGQRETIRWEQIRRMKWVPLYGLILRWEEPQTEHQQRSQTFREEFRWDRVYRQYRANLDVQKEEAQRLMSALQKKTGITGESLKI